MVNKGSRFRVQGSGVQWDTPMKWFPDFIGQADLPSIGGQAWRVDPV